MHWNETKNHARGARSYFPCPPTLKNFLFLTVVGIGMGIIDSGRVRSAGEPWRHSSGFEDQARGLEAGGVLYS